MVLHINGVLKHRYWHLQPGRALDFNDTEN